MNKRNQKPQGFIAMVSLLIVGTIALFLSLSMLTDGVNNASLSLGGIHYENARININTCLEDALLRMKQEETFNQNLNYTISESNACSTTIEWFAETPISQGITERLANLDVTGVSNGFTRNFRYELRVTRFDVNYSDDSLEHMNNIHFESITEIST